MERTYEVINGAGLPGWEDLPEVAAELGPDDELVETVYFDTPSLKLARAGVTVRRSAGGTDPGWFLTISTGDRPREEQRLPLGRAVRTVPKALGLLVRVHARGEDLGPVARTTVRRSRRRLLDDEGGLLVQVIADNVSAERIGEPADSPTEADVSAAWSEIEVEMVGGGASLLRAVEERLLAAGARPIAAAVPVRRLLADRLLADRWPADKLPATMDAPVRRLRSRSPAGDVVLAYLRDQVRTIKAHDPGVRGDDPEAVHDMRIAIRRLRTALRVFPVLDKERARAIGDELRWLGTVLGGVRDHEVLQEWLAERLAAQPPELVIGPVRERIDGYFARERTAARGQLLSELDGPRYFTLLDDLDALVVDPPLADDARDKADALLPKRVRSTLRRLDEAASHAVTLPEGADRDTAFHEARKAAKRVRYAAELVRPALGKKDRKRAKRFVSGLKDLQDVLGARQDTVVARHALVDVARQAHLAGENAFTFGVLHEAAAAEAHDADDGFRTVWRRATAPAHLRWLA